MDKAQVDRWLQAYVGAWKSYDPDQIGELFSKDVRYRYHPHDDPVAGRAELVRSPSRDLVDPQMKAGIGGSD